MLDVVVDRRELKATIARALRFMGSRVAGVRDGGGSRRIRRPPTAA